MATAWENFHFAIAELVSSAPIKQRLICAYRRHLAAIREEQLPVEIRAPFGAILRSLSGVAPLRGEDAVAASVRKMSNHDADECAALIVETFGLMCRAQAPMICSVNPPHRLHGIDADGAAFESPALIVSH